MPRIRCLYMDCAFIDEGYCSAAAIELDPDSGCITYSPADGISPDVDWVEDELEEWDEIDAEDDDEEEDDLWLNEGNGF